jgi:hypothetical protein
MPRLRRRAQPVMGDWARLMTGSPSSSSTAARSVTNWSTSGTILTSTSSPSMAFSTFSTSWCASRGSARKIWFTR